MTSTPDGQDQTDDLAANLGDDGPADTAQGLDVESQRDLTQDGPDEARDDDSDEVARQEAEQGGG